MVPCCTLAVCTTADWSQHIGPNVTMYKGRVQWTNFSFLLSNTQWSAQSSFPALGYIIFRSRVHMFLYKISIGK